MLVKIVASFMVVVSSPAVFGDEPVADGCKLALSGSFATAESIDSERRELDENLVKFKAVYAARLAGISADRKGEDFGHAGISGALDSVLSKQVAALYTEFNAIGERLKAPTSAEAGKSGARALVQSLVRRVRGRLPPTLESYAENFAREIPNFESVGRKIMAEVAVAEERQASAEAEITGLKGELRHAVEGRKQMLEFLLRVDAQRLSVVENLRTDFDRKIYQRVAHVIEELDEYASYLEGLVKLRETRAQKAETAISFLKRKVPLALARIRQTAIMIEDDDHQARLMRAGNKLEELSGSSFDLAVTSAIRLLEEVDKMEAVTSTTRDAGAASLSRLETALRASEARTRQTDVDISQKIREFRERTAKLEMYLPPPATRGETSEP